MFRPFPALSGPHFRPFPPTDNGLVQQDRRMAPARARAPAGLQRQKSEDQDVPQQHDYPRSAREARRRSRARASSAPAFPSSACSASSPASASASPPFRKYRPQMGRLPAKFESNANAKLAVRKAQLGLSDGVEIDMFGQNRSSEASYTKHYNGFHRFCLLIGAIDSLFALQKAPPKPCPAVDPDHIQLYIKYKTAKKGTTVLHPSGEPLKDAFGDDVKALGGWNAPVNSDQFISAFRLLHNCTGNSGEYQDACEKCIEGVAEDPKFEGCYWHFHKRQIIRSGNPQKFPSLDRVLKANRKNSTHVAQGDSYLTPLELFDIREKILSFRKGFVQSLQLFTFVLIGIRLFLREDEVAGLSFDSVVPELTVYKNGVLVQLGLKIKGKTDRDTILVLLHRDDNIPELCPIRHLLLLLKLEGISEGYFFCDKPGDGSNPVAYDRILERMKAVLTDLVGDFKWGTHTMRKSGYMFAVWGGAQELCMMQAARHKTYKNAERYIMDAKAVLQTAKNEGNTALLEVVPTWKPIYVRDAQRILQTRRHDFDPALISLKQCVDDNAASLGIGVRHMDHVLLLKAMVKHVDHATLDDELAAELGRVAAKIGDPNELTKLRTLLGLLAARGRPDAGAMPGADPTDTEPEDQVAAAATAAIFESVATKSIPKKRKRVDGTYDLPARKKMAKQTSGATKLDVLLEAAAEFRAKPEDERLKETARKWKANTMDPALGCYTNHCGSNKAEFVQRWGNFNVSNCSKVCDGDATSVCNRV